MVNSKDSHFPKEAGVVSKENVIFHEPTELALKIHHYVMWGARFNCDSPYRIERDYMDAFMLFRIRKGSLNYIYRGKKFALSENKMVLLDCKFENIYFATEPVSYDWFHFSGGLTQVICDELYKKIGCVFAADRNYVAQKNLDAIFHDILTSGVDEDKISMYIYKILCSLFHSINSSPYFNVLQNVTDYIKQHYTENISNDALAKMANVSRYHFMRIFKTDLGVSPHKFLLNVRIARAKELLSETNYSIEEIASLCGFSSYTYFMRAFLRRTNMTAGNFRKLQKTII